MQNIIFYPFCIADVDVLVFKGIKIGNYGDLQVGMDELAIMDVHNYNLYKEMEGWSIPKLMWHADKELNAIIEEFEKIELKDKGKQHFIM